MLLENINIFRGNNLFYKCAGDFFPCRICRVKNTTMTVTTFLCEMIILLIIFSSKGNPLLDQPSHRIRTILNDKAYRIFMTQPGPGNESVGNVSISAIVFVKYCRDTALRQPGCSTLQRNLTDQSYSQMLVQLQSTGKSSSTTANNKNVIKIILLHCYATQIWSAMII